MAGTYFTPGVFVEEISSFPASISQVQTCIPGFVGYTELVPSPNDPVKIESLVDFEATFGGPDIRVGITIVDGSPSGLVAQDIAPTNEFRKHNLYYALATFFANGGGPCYVVSAGAFPAIGSSQFDGPTMSTALDKLVRIDEPTLLVIPEAYHLGSGTAETVQIDMLEQCALLKDRFAILDAIADQATPNTAGWGFVNYRTNIGTQNLSYGAAYYPPLITALSYQYNGQDGTLDKTQIQVVKTGGGAFDTDLADAVTNAFITPAEESDILNWLSTQNPIAAVELPPSPVIAGVYCTVDKNRGVWKAPANISMFSVTKAKYKMSKAQLEDMNVPNDGGGKAVNAIRPFAGRGTLVWGARTLDGNSNEWRYIPVRRLYIMVEESTKKATEFVVFEPNDANTWQRVKGMIENFLNTIWRDGGLAGATPAQAYYVNVGLGTTMTSQDILEGKLIVEIGMAAVRPAEFIVFKFSHKVQVS